MKGRTLSILLCVFFFLSLVSSSQAQEERRVWAFYLGFWAGGQSWDWQASVLDDYPAIGRYDSRDGGVAATQIEQAQSAGIDGFVVSWYGLSDQQTTTPVFNNMLDRAGERGFQVGVAIDAFSPNFFNRDNLINSLNWIVNDRSNHHAYLRYQGKPVIFFAFQGNLGYATAEWQAIRNQVDPNHNTIWIAEGLNGCCLYAGAMDGMYAFNLAWGNGSSSTYSTQRSRALNAGASLYIPTIHPGWDETRIAARDNRPNPTTPRLRNNGQFLASSFQGAVASGANVILVGTWNEFIENSHIEPSVLYGTNSLDTLRPLVTNWKGTGGGAAPVAAAADNGAASLQATVVLNVRAGAGTNFEVLGRISPNIPYPIIRQEGAWYVINFEGREGYVSASYVRVQGLSANTTNTAAPSYPAIQATTRLNVRAGASTDFDSLGLILPNTWYAIIREENGWYVIDYNGQEGYVLGRFVQRN